MNNVHSMFGTWQSYLSAITFPLTPEMEHLRTHGQVNFRNLEVIGLDEVQFERTMRKLTIAVLNSVPSHYQHYVQEAATSAVELVHRLKWDEMGLSLAMHQALYLASVAQWYEFFITKMPEIRVMQASQHAYDILHKNGVNVGMQYAVAQLIRVGHLITGQWLNTPETRLELAHCVGLLTPLVATEDMWFKFARMRYTLTPRLTDTPIADDEYSHTRSVEDLFYLASVLELLPTGSYNRGTDLSKNIRELIEQIHV